MNIELQEGIKFLVSPSQPTFIKKENVKLTVTAINKIKGSDFFVAFFKDDLLMTFE